MESRSGRRRLAAQPPRGGAGRNCRPRRCPGGDGGGLVDRISELNDDLLIQVLVRLQSAAAAARTSVLSRRWRSVWRQLPELYFRGIAHDALEAAIAQAALPKLSLSLLDIDIPVFLPAKAVTSLLRAAARLDPVELSIAISWVNPLPIKLPSFARATSIRLHVNYLYLAPPELGGEFPALERLSITKSGIRFDTGALISRCPRLRVLELIYCRDLDYITVHSETIEELLVIGGERLRGVKIVAPVLKKFTLDSNVSVGFTMSLLAPTVENLSWNCRFTRRFAPQIEGLHGSGMWYLNDLRLGMEEHGFVLGLDIGRPYSETHVRNLQDMFQFPNISVLELCLTTRGHVYGAVVLKLLRVCSSIQRLKVVIDEWRKEACPPS